MWRGRGEIYTARVNKETKEKRILTEDEQWNKDFLEEALDQVSQREWLLLALYGIEGSHNK